VFCWALVQTSSTAVAQSFGIELHSTLMPASGAMAGACTARPQDVQSAFAGNPAALTQFCGTSFSFGGAWTEPTYNIGHRGGVLPRLGAFYAKSEAEGSALGNIGITQQLEIMGRPANFGIGLLGTAGAGVSLRNVPESNGTSVTMSVLQIAPAVAVGVTDRLSVGAAIMLGSSTLDAPFQGAGAAALAYSLRGAMGLTYQLAPCTTLGASFHTSQNFNYDDAIRLQIDAVNLSTAVDVNAGLPANYAVGVANNRLMDGRLLLAADVLFKHWDTAYMFGDLYTNQWVLQLGAQYCINPRIRLRLGYAYAENPIDTTLGQSVGGVVPPGLAPQVEAGLQYVQSTVAVINQHRFTGGIGIRDVLPGLNMDLFAGGMPRASQDFGEYTWASLQSYWVGGGLTWHFGGGCCDSKSYK
jgi:long-chain fatty acid transport protein